MLGKLSRAVLLLLPVLTVVRCGGGDICLNCEALPTPTAGPRDFVTVSGDISSWSTLDPVEDIVVIACVGLDPSLTQPTDFNDCPSKRTGYPDSDGNFSITNVDEGALRVAFWIPRSQTPTGMIEPGDSFAELSDPDDVLDDMENGQTASISGIDVDFGSGVATAGRIEVQTTPTPTPGASPTPTP